MTNFNQETRPLAYLLAGTAFVLMALTGLSGWAYHKHQALIHDRAVAEYEAKKEREKADKEHAQRTKEFREQNPIPKCNPKEKDILARLMFGEARSNGDANRIAKAYTAIARSKDKNKRWSNNLIEVVLEPFQYSCFNPNDTNYVKVWNPEKYDKISWKECQEIAEKILTKKVKNSAPGANHYHDRGPTNRPYWTKGAKLIKVSEGTEFYKK